MRETLLKILMVAASLLLSAAPASASERVALLIGNGEYRHTGRLSSPAADVAAMADALRRLDYEVETATDLDRRAMGRALRRFARRAEGADIAILYYSGHGMEIGGRNYLVPVDAELQREDDAGFESIALDDVANAAGAARRLSVIILDACRDNRFASSTKGGAKGFRAIRAKPGQLIAYAAAAGAVAFDGSGALSPYTQALTEALSDPERARSDVRVLFGGLSRRVTELAGARQDPAVYQSGFGPERLALAPSRASTEDARAAPARREAAAKAGYQAAQSLGTADAFADVADLYPETIWGLQARRQAEALRRRPPAPPTAARPRAPEGPASSPPETPDAAAAAMTAHQEALRAARRGDLASAEALVKAALEGDLGDRYAGPATHLLGETYRKRDRFREAAAAYVTALTRYPNHSEARDSWVHLGMSLAEIGDNALACAIYRHVAATVPGRITNALSSRAKRVSCDLNAAESRPPSELLASASIAIAPESQPPRRADSALSSGEMSALSAAVARQWSPPAPGPDPASLRVVLEIRLSRAGALASAPKVVEPTGDTTRRQTAAIGAARSAVLRSAPYQAPVETYAAWRRLRLVFDPMKSQVSIE